MVTAKELKYRTLDEVLNAVKTDLRAYTGENQIEAQELIKVIQKCNKDIGLVINQTKETILEIEHGRAKLPEDFHLMNFAMFTYNYQVVTPSIGNGLRQRDVILYDTVGESPNMTTCPCWTVTSEGVQATVTHCDGSTESVYFPPNDDNTPKTIKMCAISFTDIAPVIPGNTFTYTTSSFCYNDPETAQFTCTIPENCGCGITGNVNTCEAIHPDPWNQNKVYTICDNQIGVKIVQICGYECREYTEVAPVYLTPARHPSAFSTNRNYTMVANQAQIKNGFMEFAIPCGQVYINYQGILENDNGELLTIDDPIINDYYEYSAKTRVLENMYLNGEPDLERRLNYIQGRRKQARLEAMTLVNTPDYRVMTETFQIIRNNAMQRFAAPLSRYFGPYSWLSYVDQWANGLYAE